MQPRQGIIMVKFDMISHLDNLVEDRLVELTVVIEIECSVVVLLAITELLEDWGDLVAGVQLVYYLRQEVRLFGLLCVEG